MECYCVTCDLFGILVAFVLLHDRNQILCRNHTHLECGPLLCHLWLVLKLLLLGLPCILASVLLPQCTLALLLLLSPRLPFSVFTSSPPVSDLSSS